MDVPVTVFDRLSEAREGIVRAAIWLAGADAQMRFAIDAADREGRPSADLKVLRSEVPAHLDAGATPVRGLYP